MSPQSFIDIAVKRLRLLTAFIALLFASSSSACVLKVGWEDWHPYIYQADGKFLGSEYKQLTAIAKHAGCVLDFKDRPWARALLELRSGQLDLLYGASKTEEREAFAKFSEPYRIERMVLATTPKNESGSVSLASWLKEKNLQASPKRIATIIGFFYGNEINQVLTKSKTFYKATEVTKDDQLKHMLLKKRIDGYLIESVVGRAHQKTSKNLIHLQEIEEAKGEPMHLMLSKSISDELLEKINQGIAASVASAN